MRENVVTSESTSAENISEEAIREALSCILESAIFIQSDRLSRFLRFTCDSVRRGGHLEGVPDGHGGIRPQASISPSADSIVRSEARRLRNKLRETTNPLVRTTQFLSTIGPAAMYLPFDTSAVYETTVLRQIEHWVSFSLRN